MIRPGKISIAGYTFKQTGNGFEQWEKPGFLLYVKYLQRWYGAEHHPSICWKGEGYTMNHIERKNLGEVEIFTAKLIKENTTLFTAWWYQSKNTVTTRQSVWRKGKIKGETFYLVNLTSENPKNLMNEAELLVKGFDFIGK